jgi:probable HAF family extracellular repeat protein
MKPRSSSQPRARASLAARTLTAISAAGLLVSFAAAHAGAVGALPDPFSYEIEEMAALPGIRTVATGINNAGQVVGYSFDAPDCCARAFAFTPGLGSTFPQPAGPITYGQAINQAGTIAGDFDISYGGGGYRAFLFSGGFTLLPPLSTYPYSQGLGVNAFDEVIGDAYDFQHRRAFLYSQALGGMVDLGTNGGVNSYARGVNDADRVVGYYDMGASRDIWRPGTAFVWDLGHGMRDLNAITTGLSQNSGTFDLRKATAVNNHHDQFVREQIVGFAGDDNTGIVRAFRLDRTIGGARPYAFLDLGTFPNSGISYAMGVNDAGAAVGGAYKDGNDRAALFANGQVIDLTDQLKLLDRLKWTLIEATGINENGEISGWGTQADGELHAFKLTPRPHIDVDGAPRRGRQAVLGVEGTAFRAGERVQFALTRDDIGGRSIGRGSARADVGGRVAWGDPSVLCGVDYVVSAWGEASGAYSNAGKINIACP